jgi:hypothetical protein
VKVYDYLMRGGAVPSTQAFTGHFKWPRRAVFSPDMRFVYSLGDGNGLFRWAFFGDGDTPSDIERHYEEIEVSPHT